MQINVRYLDNLKIEASFDNYKVIADQPVRYKGDGSAPGPYDYFLASSAMCAAYFVKVYCKTRGIPTDEIKVTQQNIVDPENRYKQDFHLKIDLPPEISEKDKKGIIASMERCTVKRVIQNEIGFVIEASQLDEKLGAIDELNLSQKEGEESLLGKDKRPLETIQKMNQVLKDIGIKIEIASWRNPIPNVWSVHVRDADSPMCYTNGKGVSKTAALCSALGEYIERLSSNYFYSDYYLGEKLSNGEFIHYPDEKWFEIQDSEVLPNGLLDSYTKKIYDPQKELRPSHLIDTNSGRSDKGICALPFIRQSDQEVVYLPVNVLANLYASNGMSAGNSKFEARVQCLSEILERAIKNKIIFEELSLPDVPKEILEKYPQILFGIQALEKQGFPIVVKDASLGGNFPVLCVCLLNPNNGGAFASFGSHPHFEVALERCLTELLQGRSFEGMNEVPPPTLRTEAVTEPNNIVDHFIDSTGVLSWKFFSEKTDFGFFPWDFQGTTEEQFIHLMEIFEKLEKEVYLADYQDLGLPACRIIVPGFSEIYEVDDLVWDNQNRALEFREPILNLHQLTKEEQNLLLEKLEESELDDFMPISELIGVSFDETDAWSRLTIGEIKLLLCLSLGDIENAHHYLQMINTFNDLQTERKTFFQLLNIVLESMLREDISLSHLRSSLDKIYGKKNVERALGLASGENRFDGLVETDLNFKNNEKHQKLIESYQKLIEARKRFSQLS